MTVLRQQQGLAALETMFQQAKSENRTAFLPYFPIGFPNYEASLESIETMAAEGVDGFEIGIPFSDPLADGPVVQAATQIALQNGTTVKKCLEAVKTLRDRGVTQPMMMMGYANPFVAYGTEQFVLDAKAAGADGFIIPDLPAEEAHYFADVCEREGMALIFFIAPTGSDERMRISAEKATGFIYVVSLVGITGTQNVAPEELVQFIKRIRSVTDTPLVLGFGIKTPDHARAIKSLVDGFIIGTAMVNAGEAGTEAVRNLSRSVINAIK